MIIFFSKKFKKSFKKLSVTLQDSFEERLFLLKKDKFHPLLCNHKLQGEYFGCRSINVSGDIRAIFKEHDNSDIVFIDIGTHSRLY